MSNISLSDISRPVKTDLEQFNQLFKKSLRSKVGLVDLVAKYILKQKGKKIRPTLVLLSGKLAGGVSERSLRGAILVELLHTATLVHDDVVDDAYERRGFFSINALWKNKIAVLVGDYLFSQGMLLALKNKQYHLLEIVSDAVKAMSEGELLQIEKARRLDIKESIYYDIIRQKTASLIASDCSAGAASVTNDPEIIEKMRLFGEKIGIGNHRHPSIRCLPFSFWFINNITDRNRPRLVYSGVKFHIKIPVCFPPTGILFRSR